MIADPLRVFDPRPAVAAIPPLIAHLVPHPDRMVGMCGARLRGILNPEGDVCVVCLDLAEGMGYDLTNLT